MKTLKAHIHFLHLFVASNRVQFKALVKTITKSQLHALLEVIFNLLKGTFEISLNTKKLFNTDKKAIRQVCDRGVSKKKKIILLIKHSGTFKRIVPIALKQVADYHGSRVSSHTKRRI